MGFRKEKTAEPGSTPHGTGSSDRSNARCGKKNPLALGSARGERRPVSGDVTIE